MNQNDEDQGPDEAAGPPTRARSRSRTTTSPSTSNCSTATAPANWLPSTTRGPVNLLSTRGTNTSEGCPRRGGRTDRRRGPRPKADDRNELCEYILEGRTSFASGGETPPPPVFHAQDLVARVRVGGRPGADGPNARAGDTENGPHVHGLKGSRWALYCHPDGRCGSMP